MKNNIQKFREKRFNGCISKADLAREIEVSRSYITKLEQGKVQPSIKTAHKLAKYLQCNIEELFENLN